MRDGNRRSKSCHFELHVFYFKMRNTTVSVLLFLISVFADAQDISSSQKMVHITNISEEGNMLQHRDVNVRLIEVNENVSVSYLTNQGVEIYRRLTENIFIVRQSQEISRLSPENVKQKHDVNYRWKLGEGVTTLKPGHYILKTKSRSSGLTVAGVKIISSYDNYLRVEVALREDWPALLKNSDVIYIGKESFDAREESRVLDQNLNPNHINQVHHFFPELNGNGITVSFKERHYHIDDLDLIGRHVPSTLGSAETSTHATDMATITAGAGNSFVTGKGVVPNALITSSTFEDLFPDTDQEFGSLNVFVQNHSYGTEVESFYGALAEAYDQSARRNPALLHVFSSGNQGGAAPASGKYKDLTGYANITGNSKMAKNTIVVGASDTTGGPMFFSSRGPAHDGRVKPDVVAYSTTGSSNSAALVSGVVAMLQQAHKNKTGTYPSSALVKALLINGASDVHNPGVDFFSGFGNVDAFRSMKVLQDENIFSGTIRNGETLDFTLTVPSSSKNLKITLCWNDPPATVNAISALVNDLDLTLSAGASTWQPWILNTAPTVTALNEHAVRGEDHLNNVEQISLEAPDAGSYTVRVSGTNLSTADQEFFIVYQWETNQSFTWQYPTASDHFPYNGETGTYFYWESTLASATGNLEYSTDNGTSWSVIKSGLDLAKGHYRWDVSSFPNDRAVVAKARMVTDVGIFTTELFTIANTWFPEIGFNCGDSVLFQWSARSGVEKYELFTLMENVMTPVRETEDTFLILRKSDFTSPYFSIQPILTDNKKALRTSAVNYELLGSCYVTAFTEEVVPDEGVYLDLTIGSTYAIARIVFEREDQFGNFSFVAEAENVTGRNIRVLDAQPIQGLNRYRARLLTVNGSQILSPILDVFFITPSTYIVFPNPVRTGSELNVFSGDAESFHATFELFKSDGSLSRAIALSSDREFVSLANLHPGIYIYRIVSERGVFRGKIFIY